ncbi:cytochrome c oxidase assembly factor Coa1 family protein [Vibrio sp. Vb339]|uniref:cytochrome c oxidase assembly factor Coa1 family protein n=1 Tax=Vibrio sp. Vb339 TaxID=1192013 RepID=UPI0015559F57|nr:cytochrome c oxidase assembly factor Coa1 family protein [Vibrio sp. Vb339]
MEREEYVSGLGKASIIPPDIKGWSWGAFLLNWIWGVGNGTYIALLMFIPLVNIVMIFVLGFKGNEWAWRNRLWRDVDHFKSTQKKWRNAGFASLLLIPLLFSFLFSALKGEAYDQSLYAITHDIEVVRAFGEPIETGFFTFGNIRTSADGGEASLQYSIQGPTAEGEAYVKAYKSGDEWSLYEVVVHLPSGQQINVVTPE